ncbi:hypothetical protein JY651_36525 [Pyxidicoccus parkwayensis]|uniref:Uncharacterized protein n=1 Tax=Pyxidicoccus parkwayensis TaxID=2813578 RepID=A0ABX7NPA7_9BACT|nr:S28 family serine protease [Pyxidicoccus parkwaysis]QSQ20699.1 hypothetical protein JY651_36525 [Pyxidicoccus parkwaysis]
MQKLIRRPFIALGCALALGLQACGGDASLPVGEAPPSPDIAAASTPLDAPVSRAALDGETDILAALQAIPGLTVVREGTTPLPGARFFILSYDQPVDHHHPEGARFQQRLTLLHVSTQAPMVLASTGYGISTSSSRTEPTFLLGANQLRVEHRFFGPSTPVPATWEHLTLGQAAADHHRIVTAFKALYSGKWVSTGASKGGMTSIYHRALYPNDVDATVAYVAPNSYGPQDPRYINFLSRVGDEACRQRIRDFQRDALSRRDELVPAMSLAAAAQGLTFDFLGMDKAFEFILLELPFAFWQYGSAELCPFIPTPGAPAEEVVWAMDGIVGLYGFADDSIYYYAPYYFQAGTQLGSYRSDERHLRGLLHYPRQYAPASLVPFSLEPYGFDHFAMPLVAAWVKTRGERILLVYGENDPWSTNAFEVRERNDSFRFFVPGGNHGSSISSLPDAERALAMEKLTTWAGLSSAKARASLAASVPATQEELAEMVRERRRGPPRE